MAAKRRANLPASVREYLAAIGRRGGRLGGALGGRRRAERLTPLERHLIAKKAAAARWGQRKR